MISAVEADLFGLNVIGPARQRGKLLDAVVGFRHAEGFGKTDQVIAS